MLRAIEIVEAGFRTTVEDLGRPAATRHGVPAGGAFDPAALRALNGALGNDPEAAGLELWMHGPLLVNVGVEPVVVALAGADFGWELMRDGLPRIMPPGAPLSLRPRERLTIRAPARGGRAWLGLAGGVDVPLVLGSRSTCLAAGFGGFAGRALRAGDCLAIGPVQGPVLAGPRRVAGDHSVLPSGSRGTALDAAHGPGETVLLRVLPGPQATALTPEASSGLTEACWRVSEACDRIGIRLELEESRAAPYITATRGLGSLGSAGSPCASAPVGIDALGPAASPLMAGPAGIEPEGTTLGAVQLPPDGRPVLLGPDRPATGGYAKPLLVARADLGRLASLVPGDRVRLVAISLDEALALLATENRRSTSS